MSPTVSGCFWKLVSLEVYLALFLSSFLINPVECISSQVIGTNREGSEEFDSEQADFGPPFAVLGYTGLLLVSKPLNGCVVLNNAPSDRYEDYGYFLLIEQGDCEFQDKVLNAQRAGYDAVIVYNHLNNKIIRMAGNGREDVDIPSTFVGRADGLKLGANYTSDGRTFNAKVVIKGEFLIPLRCYLIPFVVIVGVCFSIMLLFVLFKLVRDHRAKLKNRLSRRGLRKLPTKKWKKGDVDCIGWESCAICLEDYEDGHKLRVLPCKHAFHCKCIDPWLTETRRVCPLCKQRITPRGELEEPSPPTSPNPINNDEDNEELSEPDTSQSSERNDRESVNSSTVLRVNPFLPNNNTPHATSSAYASSDDSGNEQQDYVNGSDDCPLLNVRNQRTSNIHSSLVSDSDGGSSSKSSRFSKLLGRLGSGRGGANSVRSNEDVVVESGRSSLRNGNSHTFSLPSSRVENQSHVQGNNVSADQMVVSSEGCSYEAPAAAHSIDDDNRSVNSSIASKRSSRTVSSSKSSISNAASTAVSALVSKQSPPEKTNAPIDQCSPSSSHIRSISDRVEEDSAAVEIVSNSSRSRVSALNEKEDPRKTILSTATSVADDVTDVRMLEDV